LEIDHVINFGDISFVIDAFRGYRYPDIMDICSEPPGQGGRPLIGHQPCDCPTACPGGRSSAVVESPTDDSTAGGESTAGPRAETDFGADRARVFITPLEASLKAGESIGFEVYTTGAGNVAVFEVALDVSDGSAGTLVMEDIFVDVSCEKFLFGTVESLQAVDAANGRLGAAAFDGGVDAVEPAYLGTFVFRATEDASGTFHVSLRDGIGTFLRDGEGVPIPFERGPAVAINVLAPEGRKPIRSLGR
jgi:hypothetical protein